MKIKSIETEWFQDYKLPSMFIAFPKCSFKCNKEYEKHICQNSKLANCPDIEMDTGFIINKYLSNPITKAIVCGGLEPFDSFDELHAFIAMIRNDYRCDDTVVIYTGYERKEIENQIKSLQNFKNIVVKFGRFIPNHTSHTDKVLRITLSSNNQYAEEIS